jgi:hypothetical protein
MSYHLKARATNAIHRQKVQCQHVHEKLKEQCQ